MKRELAIKAVDNLIDIKYELRNISNILKKILEKLNE